jgi:PAS domain-containing protein
LSERRPDAGHVAPRQARGRPEDLGGSDSGIDGPSADAAVERTRWELAIEAAGIGSFDWNLVTGRLVWDDRLIDLFGYDKRSFDHSIDAFYHRLHPDDRARVSAALNGAIDA